MHYIEVKNVQKIIHGNKVLKNINLSFTSGQVYGIVGNNGSGKTMLFRILSGLIRPTSGDVFIDGKNIEEAKQNHLKIGMIIENASLYPDFTGLKNLMFLSKINNYIGENDVRHAITRVGLDPQDKRTIRKYSLGMKQRIAMAQAIMEFPDFLFLDEPTNALDTEGIELFRKLIQEEAERGALIIIASHNKDDIEMLCNKTLQMKEGQLY